MLKTYGFPAIHFHPRVREGVQTARCEADLFQRALCNGWRSCMDRREHLRFFFMTSSQLHCRGPRPLTSPGLVHILATPSPPIVWGWPLFLQSFQTERPCNLQNGPFGSESSPLSLLIKYTLEVKGQLDTLWPKSELLSL